MTFRGLTASPLKLSNLQFLQSVPEEAPFSAKACRHKCLRSEQATTGHVPVERCSSPATIPAGTPPQRGLPPLGDAPRQQTALSGGEQRYAGTSPAVAGNGYGARAGEEQRYAGTSPAVAGICRLVVIRFMLALKGSPYGHGQNCAGPSSGQLPSQVDRLTIKALPNLLGDRPEPLISQAENREVIYRPPQT